MQISSPKIEKTTFIELLQQAQAAAQFYTPEWNALPDKDAGLALLKIYLHFYEQISSRFNQVPEKNLIAFLDMLGIKLLPAKSATVPVTFSLAEGAKENVLVAQGTQLTATAETDGEEILYETEKNLTVFAAALQEVFSIDAQADQIYHHSQSLKDQKSFAAFSGTNKQEHSLFLAHKALFNQIQPAEIIVDFVIRSAASDINEFAIVWEYWNGKNWVALAKIDGNSTEDTTQLFQKSGKMTLKKNHSGEIQTLKINNIESRWLRARIITPALSKVIPVTLPTFDTIRLEVNPISPLLPELAFNNDIPLQVTPLKVSMRGMDIKIAYVDKDITSPPLEDNTSVVLAVSANLSKDDILVFDNGKDDPEWRAIEEPSPLEDFPFTNIDSPVGMYPAIVKLRDLITNEIKGLENEYSERSRVKLQTAIRKNNLEVLVDSLEGIEEIENSKVLFADDPDEDIYIDNETPYELSSLHNPGSETVSHLTLLGARGSKINHNYLEDDFIKILPQIKPFGKIPRLFDSCYLANNEAFSKNGATITLNIDAEWHGWSSPPDDDIKPVLIWEYWNDKSWRELRVADTTANFQHEGKVIFTCPKDIAMTKVNGEEKYWIRLRLIDGDYGKEIKLATNETGPTSVPGEVRAVKGQVYYPIIKQLDIKYKSVKQPPEYCLTVNNLDLVDRTTDCIIADKTFDPFAILPEQYPAIFLGFTQSLVGGPFQILISLNEQIISETDRVKMEWSYWNGSRWALLNLVDFTENLTKIGVLQWIGPRDHQKKRLFGNDLYWLKGALVEGVHPEAVQIHGIYPNTTEAFQAFVVEEEFIGPSDGTPNQSFTLLKIPVISQNIWIKELENPGEAELKEIQAKISKDFIKTDLNAAGEITALWILWQAVEDFDNSDSDSRHYTIDNRLGTILFGNGENGMIPPFGADNIKVNYKYGGGKNGNVRKGAVTGLKNAIPFVNAVMNYIAADGGAETEVLNQALVRGPQGLKNRDRSVTAEDFEWLTKNASRKVARAKCIPNMSSSKELTPGWVTILIVPDSDEDPPKASNQLIKVVTEKLQSQCPNTVSHPKHFHVRQPDYVEIVVQATVIPTQMEEAANLEKEIVTKLKGYIHPLKGGAQQTGWEFGQSICRSDLYALLEGIANVDFIADLVIQADGKTISGDIALDTYTLPYSGMHQISLMMAAEIQNSSKNLKKSECVD